MEWNVYYQNVNKRTIEKWNIFNHGRFAEDVKSLKGIDDKECFAAELKIALQYSFWHKCEYEVLINGFPPSFKDVEKKVDIYDQVMLNWDIFVEYVWRRRKKL